MLPTTVGACELCADWGFRAFTDFKSLYGAANGWHAANAQLYTCRPTYADDCQALTLKILPNSAALTAASSANMPGESLVAGTSLGSVGVWSLHQTGPPQLKLSSTVCDKRDEGKGVVAFEHLGGKHLAVGDDHGQIHILEASTSNAAQGPCLQSIHKAGQASFW